MPRQAAHGSESPLAGQASIGVLSVVEQYAGHRPGPIDEQQRGDEAQRKAEDPIGYEGHDTQRGQHHPRPQLPGPARRPPTQGVGTSESSARTHVRTFFAQGYAPTRAPRGPNSHTPRGLWSSRRVRAWLARSVLCQRLLAPPCKMLEGPAGSATAPRRTTPPKLPERARLRSSGEGAGVVQTELARAQARGDWVVGRAPPRRGARFEVDQQPERAVGGLDV
jgi:hypothetical protein